MTRPTTHWSLTGDLHAGAVDGCGRCEDGLRRVEGVPFEYDAVLADRVAQAREERRKARETRDAATGRDLRAAAVGEDVSDRDRPAERRTAIQEDEK